MTDRRADSPMVTTCVLYTNTNSAGLEYLAGNWGMARVFVFGIKPQNQKPGGPTHRVVFGERRDQEGRREGTEPEDAPPIERDFSVGRALLGLDPEDAPPAERTPGAEAPRGPSTDDDIPF